MFRSFPFAAFIILVAVACKTSSKASDSMALNVDSTAGAIVLPVVVPPDSGTLKAGIRLTADGCFGLDALEVTTTKGMKMKASIDSTGVLSVTAKTTPDTLEREVRVWTKSIRKESTSTTEPKEKNYVPIVVLALLVAIIIAVMRRE